MHHSRGHALHSMARDRTEHPRSGGHAGAHHCSSVATAGGSRSLTKWTCAPSGSTWAAPGACLSLSRGMTPWCHAHIGTPWHPHLPQAHSFAQQLSDTRRRVCRAGGRTATSGLGRSDSHCSPVNTSTADRPMTTTSARDCDELASATGATCKTKAVDVNTLAWTMCTGLAPSRSAACSSGRCFKCGGRPAVLSPCGQLTPDARRLASTPPMPSAPAASGTLRSAPSKRTAQSKSSSGGTCAREASLDCHV